MVNKTSVFDKGLYGLRSSGARFHEHLSDILRKIDSYHPKQTQTHGTKIVECIMSTLQDMLMASLCSQRILCR